MPRDKTATFLKLKESMRQEFMEKGYEKASLNHMAQMAGITPAGVYRHFKNKEAMFEALVGETVEAFQAFAKLTMSGVYEKIKEEGFIDQYNEVRHQWNEALIDFIYDHEEEWRLLLWGAEGTRYENFKEELIQMGIYSMQELIKYLNQNHIAESQAGIREIKMMSVLYVDAVYELVKEKISREEAHETMQLIERLLQPGWKAVLGF